MTASPHPNPNPNPNPDPSPDPDPDPDPMDTVAAVADAVLFEGYLLYPYRASARKNQLRWQFGVLTPESDGTEPTGNRTEALIEPVRAQPCSGTAAHPRPRIRLRLRCLQVQARTLEGPDGTPVDELVVDGERRLAFDEGLPRQVDAVLDLAELLAGPVTVPIALPASREVEQLADAGGAPAGRLVRECWPVTGRIVVSATDLPGPYLVHRLRLDVTNDGTGPPGAPRERLLRTSLIAAHTVLAADGARFLSLTDPPRWAEPFAAGCVNEHTWPVLAGPPERTDLLLSSPIILADHPQLAPESTIDLFDGLENDEILTLRTLVLTDEEKAEARATDPRAAGIIDAVDALPPEFLERLHGAVRSMGPARGADSPAELPPDRPPWWDPGVDSPLFDDPVDPDTDSVLVGSASGPVPVARGSAVRLHPGRGTDAQDGFLVGMRATVQAVLHDVDGATHVAVSLDGDPAAELQLAHGRFRYFRPDELEAVS